MKIAEREEEYTITIAKLLDVVGAIEAGVEIATIEDTNGRIWELPDAEDKDGVFISRYDFEPRMELRIKTKITVIEDVNKVTVLNKTSKLAPHEET